MPVFSYIYSLPYISIFFFLYINSIPILKKNGMSTLLQILIATAVLLIFIGFRGFVYTDWQSYYVVYKRCPSMLEGFSRVKAYIDNSLNNPGGMEIGFMLYMVLCKTISPDYFFLQIFSSAIDFIIIYFVFKNIIHKYIVMAFLFFILFGGLVLEFNLLRNVKGILFFIISLKYVENRSFYKFISINILGSLFHISSVLFFPLYFVLNKRIPKKLVLMLFIIGNIIYLLQIEWFRVILILISSYLPARLEILTDIYLSHELTSKASGITIGYIERFITFIVLYYNWDKLILAHKYNNIFINIAVIYLFIMLFFSEIVILIGRVGPLFIFHYWFLYPQIYSFLTKNYKIVFLGLLLIYGFLKMSTNSNVQTIYDNILFGHKSYNERVSLIKAYRRYMKN
jgi:hypothetical protein